MLEDTTKDEVDRERNAKKRTGHNLMFTGIEGNAKCKAIELPTTPVLESTDVGSLGSQRSVAALSGKEEVKVLLRPCTLIRL